MSALLNTQGIAEILGVKRRHVTAYITKRPDFPPPCINVSQRIRHWHLEDVLHWTFANFL